MRVVAQETDDIIASLSALEADWMDEIAEQIMEKICSLPKKSEYDRSDVISLLEAKSGKEFQISKFCIGIFLGFSKDKLETELSSRLENGTGIKSYTRDPESFLCALEEVGVLDAITNVVNMEPTWSDILRERLRFGRGSAIQGQQRGRGLEDYVEERVRTVFGDEFEPRCSFQGPNKTAKCDFAIPNKNNPVIVIEVKGYGATGSKMSDIIGDVDAIIEAKRNDTKFLLFTDGLTWKGRVNDLRRLVERQNDGRIARIYTKSMEQQLVDDLKTLKEEFQI